MTKNKKGITPLALFSLCAVLVVDTLTASASIGVSSLGWWVLILVIFVLPYGLIISELSSAYPGEGGIYDWVKKAFGPHWALRTTWFYWINVGLWMPAVYILFAGMFAELFVPGLSLSSQVLICVALTWATVWVCTISTDIGLLITNFCAVLKVVVISVLGIGGFIYAARHGVANEFSVSAILPSFDSGIAFLPSLVFNLMGFELVATMTREMKDVKQMPKVVFLAMTVTAFLYITGTLGILMALPAEEVGLVAGIIDTLRVLFGSEFLGQMMTYALGLLTLVTFVGNMVSWTMGSSRAAAESAREGEFPAIVGKTSAKYSTPVGASAITGLVSTTVILVYALFASSNDELFWSMFSFSSCIFLMPYLFMFPAYLKLRITDNQTSRPFKVPGGIKVQKVMTALCFLIILQAVILFIFPDIIFGKVNWQYTLPILSGVLATVFVGEALLIRAKRYNRQINTGESGINRLHTTTPQSDSFYMPGEHEPHSEVWLAWPVRSDNWRLEGKPAQKAFAEVAKAISAHTPVVMLTSPTQFEQARAMLPSHINVTEMPYDDCWMRDIGATYLLNRHGERRGVSWQFNAWGGLVDGLYSPWDQDDMVAEKMLSQTEDDVYKAPLVLEGGSIHCDGEGTLYTTEECLLHPNRNPHLSKQEIEAYLKTYLGVSKVIWLANGLYNDETNGHVDNILHIVKPGEVVITWCDDPADPQYAISRAAYDVLSREKDAQGRTITVHKLPMPGPLYISEEEASGIELSEGMERRAGERLAASYANFLISNNSVIFPLLDDKTDEQAKDIIEQLFPQHTVIGIDAREILLGGGNIHCITQQVPEPTS